MGYAKQCIMVTAIFALLQFGGAFPREAGAQPLGSDWRYFVGEPADVVIMIDLSSFQSRSAQVRRGWIYENRLIGIPTAPYDNSVSLVEINCGEGAYTVLQSTEYSAWDRIIGGFPPRFSPAQTPRYANPGTLYESVVRTVCEGGESDSVTRDFGSEAASDLGAPDGRAAFARQLFDYRLLERVRRFADMADLRSFCETFFPLEVADCVARNEYRIPRSPP